ncbi:hypothetical protein LX36DRAFT_437217 [Colletotrichum falcatum]|nr:hypothetical protein LX36DRAFT_437217 [Colletotrichum falcatum]
MDAIFVCRLAAPAEPLALTKVPFSTSERPGRGERRAHAIAYPQIDEPPRARVHDRYLAGTPTTTTPQTRPFFPLAASKTKTQPRLNPPGATSHSPAEKCQPFANPLADSDFFYQCLLTDKPPVQSHHRPFLSFPKTHQEIRQQHQRDGLPVQDPFLVCLRHCARLRKLQFCFHRPSEPPPSIFFHSKAGYLARLGMRSLASLGGEVSWSRYASRHISPGYPYEREREADSLTPTIAYPYRCPS